MAATKDFSASYGLRQRMLHFLHNIEHYMMFEVWNREIAALLPTSFAPPSHLLRTSRSPRTSLTPAVPPSPAQVLEPHSHLLGQKMRAATRPDELIAHHSAFLDACLKECMLRDAVLLVLVLCAFPALARLPAHPLVRLSRCRCSSSSSPSS